MGRQDDKAAFHSRIHAEGRFPEYSAVREQLKRDGVDPRDAWRYAASQFPPLDGSPLEVTVPVTPLSSLKIEKSEASEGLEPVAEEKAAGAVVVKPGPPVPPKAPTVHGNGKGWTLFSKGVLGATVKDEEWMKIAEQVPRERSAGALAVADWVFNHAILPPEMIDPEQVPSLGALGLLRSVRSSPKNYDGFISNIWSKLLPNRGQLDAESRFNDDGRVQLGMLADFEKSLDGESVEKEEEVEGQPVAAEGQDEGRGQDGHAEIEDELDGI